MQKQRKKIVGFGCLVIGIIVSVVAFFPNGIWFLMGFFLGDPSTGSIEISVKSTSDDRPIVSFDQGMLGSTSQSFSTIVFSELVPSKLKGQPFLIMPSQSKTVWSIRYDHGSSPDLGCITYGITPAGFKVVHAPEQLLQDHYYRVAGTQVIKKNGFSDYSVIDYEKFRRLVDDGTITDSRD